MPLNNCPLGGKRMVISDRLLELREGKSLSQGDIE